MFITRPLPLPLALSPNNMLARPSDNLGRPSGDGTRPKGRHRARGHGVRIVSALLHDFDFVHHHFPSGCGAVKCRSVLLQTAHGLFGVELHRHPPVRVARDHDHRSCQGFDPLLLRSRPQDILPNSGHPVHSQRARRVLRLQNSFGAGEPDPSTSRQCAIRRGRRGAGRAAGADADAPGAWGATL